MVTSVRSAFSWRPHPFLLPGQTSTTDVSSALEVLEGELCDDVADRVRCLRLAALWPSCPPRRIGHATDGVTGEEMLV